MNTTSLKHLLKVGGPQTELAYLVFTPNGTNNVTATESHLFDSTVTYGGSAGTWTVQLKPRVKYATVLSLHAVLGDTNYHTYEYSINQTTGVITITHKTVAYSTGLVAPTASNTSGAITITALVRVAS